ncbi:NAD(P)-binding protein [Obba rivulosa]|uniref:NAD(P)-binding protein n=1 Tax=Obba rivulosa TaxID=1052685 RepID=A0A8E2DRU9_9APHY|nr:NAD(P)-binding protein [Obba rivulosa]
MSDSGSDRVDAIVIILQSRGDNGVATLRGPNVLADRSAKYPSSRLLVLKLDVKNQEEIFVAFAKAREAFGRLDVVFNNAAYTTISEVESAQGNEDAVRDMFEVIFWGAAHITQAAIKFFREVNKPVGGRLLQLFSRAGLQGVPACGFYSATKFAFEGLSEITIVEPGPSHTTAQANFVIVPQHSAYANAPASAVRAMMDDFSKGVGLDDPKKAILKFCDLVDVPEPPLRLPIGKPAVESAKKGEDLIAAVAAYASWSEGLEFSK